MSLKSSLKDEYAECVRLITTDRKLQSFMLCVFSILALVIYSGFDWLGFGPAASYYLLADQFLGGNWDYDGYGMNLPPLVIPILMLIKSLSQDYNVFCVLLSLSGFAFYMLGGHFLLKLCRETGYPEKDAFLLLLLLFAFSLTNLTTGIATISASFVIISMWLYRREHISLSFIFLALATWAGYYPILLFLSIFFIRLRRRELKAAGREIVGYVLVCLPLLLMILHLHLEDVTAVTAYLGGMQAFGFSPYGTYSSLLCTVMFGTAVCVLITLCMKREFSDIREFTLILLISLLFLSIFYPYGDRFLMVTVFMTFILTRMGSEPGKLRMQEYITLIVLGACCFACDYLFADIEVLCAVLSAICLVATVVLLSLARKELDPMFEFPNKRK